MDGGDLHRPPYRAAVLLWYWAAVNFATFDGDNLATGLDVLGLDLLRYLNVVEATLKRGQDADGLARLDVLIYGPPSEDEWLNDPRALASQAQLMAASGGGASAEMGEAP